jgi:hypothetical protein
VRLSVPKAERIEHFYLLFVGNSSDKFGQSEFELLRRTNYLIAWLGGRPSFIAGQNFADKFKLRFMRQKSLSRVDTLSELLGFVKFIGQTVKYEAQKLGDKIKGS